MVPLTLIIPVYNGEKYLPACFDSVYAAIAKSKAEHIEVVIVDDGSTDASLRIEEAWSKRCENELPNAQVKVIRQPNSGVGAARNHGIASAHGKWLWFVDCDDMIHPESLHVLTDGLSKFDCDAVFLSVSNTDEFLPVSNGAFSAVPLVRENVERLHRSVWSTLFRSDLLGNLRFKNYVLGEDILFSMTYLNHHRKWLAVDAPLYYYRRDQNSTSHRKSTFRRVHDVLNSSSEITQQLGELTVGLNACVSWYPYCQYYTYDESLFHLPAREAGKCMHDYLGSITLVNSFWPLKRRHRLVIAILEVVPSYVLAKLLVYYPHRLFLSLLNLLTHTSCPT